MSNKIPENRPRGAGGIESQKRLEESPKGKQVRSSGGILRNSFQSFVNFLWRITAGLATDTASYSEYKKKNITVEEIIDKMNGALGLEEKAKFRKLFSSMSPVTILSFNRLLEDYPKLIPDLLKNLPETHWKDACYKILDTQNEPVLNIIRSLNAKININENTAFFFLHLIDKPVEYVNTLINIARPLLFFEGQTLKNVQEFLEGTFGLDEKKLVALEGYTKGRIKDYISSTITAKNNMDKLRNVQVKKDLPQNIQEENVQLTAIKQQHPAFFTLLLTMTEQTRTHLILNPRNV